MDVEIMLSPAPRFFRKELEKTPSPEKEEEKEKEATLGGLDFTDDVNEEYVKAMPEIEDPWAGAGDKAAADLPDLAVAEDGKVMELVHKEYIRALLKSPPRTHPLPYSSIEALRGTSIKDEDLDQLVSTYRNVQRGRDIKMDIIQQYLNKGYAYTALPVTSKMYPATAGELPPLP